MSVGIPKSSGRMAELDRLIASGTVQVNRFQFERHHPYVLADGRRFMSLKAAAQSAAGMPDATVTGPDGQLYDWEYCRRIAGMAVWR